MAKCLAFATLAVLVLAQFATAGPLVPAGAMGKLRRHANTHHSSIQSRIFAAQQAGPNETTTHAPGNPLCMNTSIFTEVDQACGNWGEASVALISLSANASVDAELNKFCSATCQTKFNEMAAWFDTCSGPGLSEAFAVLSSGCISHEGQLCAIKLRVLTRMECEDKTTQATCTEGNNLCRWNAKKSRCDMWTNNQALGDLCTPCFDQYLLLMSQLATASYEQAPAHSASQRQAANATTPAPTKKPVDQKKVAESQNQQDEFLAYQDLLCSREDDIGFCLPILQGIDEDLYNFDHEAANQSTIAEIVNATNNVCMEATERCLNRQRLSLRRLYQHDADNLFYSCAETQYLEAAYELWTFNFSDWQRVHANSTYNGTHVFWRVSPNPYAETPEQGVHYNGTHVIIDVRLAFGPAKPHRRQTVEQIEAKVNLSTCIGHWEEVMMGAAKDEAVADFTCTRNEKNQSCIVIVHEMLKNPCFGSCSGNCSAWFQDFVMNQGCCIAQLHAVYTVADFDHDAAPILEGNLSKANVTLKPDLTPTWENHLLRNWVETCHHDVTTFNYTAVKAQLLKQCPQPTVEPERTFPLQGLRWDELLANPKLKKAIEAALKADIARSLGIPAADLENATFVIDESQTLSSVKTTNRQGNATTKGAKFQFKTSGKDNAGAAKNAANFDKAASSGKLSVSGTAGVITKKCKSCIGGAPGAPAPTGNLFAALLGKSVSGATTRAANSTTRPANSTTRAPGATTRAPGLASPAPAVSGFVAAVIAAVVAMLM